MTNPNNCDTCNYKQMREIGQDHKQHCYMFYDAPTELCMQHTCHQAVDIQLTNAMRAFAKWHDKEPK